MSCPNAQLSQFVNLRISGFETKYGLAGVEVYSEGAAMYHNISFQRKMIVVQLGCVIRARRVAVDLHY